MPKFMSRSRNFIFTLNNYDDAAEERVKAIPYRYLVYGRERAPTTGTRHLQGYVTFRNARTVAGVRRLLTGAHVEVARGSPAQCKDYCIKDGDFFEDGDLPADPGTREVERWDEALKNAKEDAIEEIPSDIVLRYYRTLLKIRTDFERAPALLDGPCGIWIHGEAGTGKTYAVFDKYPTIYPKGLNKWWCAYEGGPVLVDDVDRSHGTWIAYFLKIWADRYPFIGESKGGSRKIRPSRVIVTSQYKIEDIWADEETRAALNRRFILINKVANQNIIL